MSLKCSDKPGKPVRLREGIRISQHQPFSPGKLRAAVIAGCKAEIFCLAFDKESKFRVSFLETVDAFIARSIIDQDDFKILQCLVLETVQAARQIFSTIPGDDDNGDQGRS